MGLLRLLRTIVTRWRFHVADSFSDDAGRLIRVLLDNDIVAYHGETEIGRFQMIHIEDADEPKHFVNLAQISRDYQRAGIGLNMLRIASSRWGKLTVENWQDERDLALNPLLPAGRALMTKAVKLGYVWPEEPSKEEPYNPDDYLGRD